MRPNLVTASSGQPEEGAGESAGEPWFWSIADIQFNCRLGRSTAWRLVRMPGFPAPVVLSARKLSWRRDEVLAFMEARRDADHYQTPLTTSGPDATPGGARFVARPLRSRRS